MADVNSSAQDRGSIATRAKLLLPMDYPYPEEFPQSSRARVQGESIRAARDFDRAKQEAPSKIPRLLRAYILRVFIAFVREARNLALQGLWSVDRLESESREFLRGFAITARYEKGHDRSGGLVPDMVSHWTASILPEIQRSFEQSPEWQEFQDILLEVADAQASWPERSLPGETVLDDCELKSENFGAIAGWEVKRLTGKTSPSLFSVTNGFRWRSAGKCKPATMPKSDSRTREAGSRIRPGVCCAR